MVRGVRSLRSDIEFPLEGLHLSAAIVTDQIGVAQPLALGSVDHADHLVDGVAAACVVPALEFAHVAIQVLGAHVVVDADVAALKHRPKRLHPVDVNLISDVLAKAVRHAHAAR